jgi:hypothetical protein
VISYPSRENIAPRGIITEQIDLGFALVNCQAIFPRVPLLSHFLEEDDSFPRGRKSRAINYCWVYQKGVDKHSNSLQMSFNLIEKVSTRLSDDFHAHLKGV